MVIASVQVGSRYRETHFSSHQDSRCSLLTPIKSKSKFSVSVFIVSLLPFSLKTRLQVVMRTLESNIGKVFVLMTFQEK